MCGCNKSEDQCCEDKQVQDMMAKDMPPPAQWLKQLDDAIKMESQRSQIPRLPGCGIQCEFARHHINTCKAFIDQSEKQQNIDNRIAPSDDIERQMNKKSLNILTTGADSDIGIMNVESTLVWMQVPCAVDSGACSHVAPPNLFALLGPKTNMEKPKFYGADGSPIENFGECPVNVVLDDNTKMNTLFNIAKITRPLLSVTQMTNNGHQVVFGKEESSIRIAGGNKKIKLRKDGQLWMLDMWVQVPQEIARVSPFARQVTQA